MSEKLVTMNVLASAYRGGKRGQMRDDQPLRTHAVLLDAKGEPSRVLCRGVKLESLCEEVAGMATCPKCRAVVTRWESAP